jgi:hypothetical protein
MQLPNGDRAIVDIRKLRDYCLNPDNPRGSAKAKVFLSALGITVKDSEMLRTRLLEVAAAEDATIGELDLYGHRYTIDFEMETEAGRAELRSAWIILRSESAPRLTTCFVKKRKK